MSGDPSRKRPWAVGRYLLYGEIASGGMATVHFGRLQGAAGFARSVAIKRLHPQFAKDPDFVAMFVDEARLAARIAHPNVVPTLDVVSQDGELLLVMEYVRGAALSRLLRTLTLRGERVPVRYAASVLSGVLQGLHAAHEARSEAGHPLDIVHRDVSPQNILVGTDGVARLLDFGVAKAAGRWQSTREGQLKGKTAYMAPEQISSGVVSRKTDVYAASVVLWETLTGKRLFRADNEAKLLAMVLRGDVTRPSKVAPDIPAIFDEIVLRGLDRDPDRRFATAREMANHVDSVVGSAPATEIGDWVESVADDELRQRAGRIEAIERSVPSHPPAATTPDPEVPAIPPEGSRRSHPTPGDSTSRGSHLAMVHSDLPWGRGLARRRWSLALSITAVLLLTGGLSLLVLPGSRTTRDARSTGTITTTATSTAPSGASPLATAASTPPASPMPMTTPIPSPAVGDPGSAARLAAPAPSNRSHRTLAAPPPPRPSPPRPDCTPPYTADEKGHLHFKPACL